MRLLLGLTLVAVLSTTLWADPPGLKALEIGAAAPDFHLPGVDGKTHALADFANKDILVVLFTALRPPVSPHRLAVLA